MEIQKDNHLHPDSNWPRETEIMESKTVGKNYCIYFIVFLSLRKCWSIPLFILKSNIRGNGTVIPRHSQTFGLRITVGGWVLTWYLYSAERHPSLSLVCSHHYYYHVLFPCRTGLYLNQHYFLSPWSLTIIFPSPLILEFRSLRRNKVHAKYLCIKEGKGLQNYLQIMATHWFHTQIHTLFRQPLDFNPLFSSE